MIGRIASFSQPLYLLDMSLKTQSRLAEVQEQTSSGLKSTSFSGLGSSAGALARQQGDLAQAEAESKAANGALTVLEQTYSTLGSINDLAETILSTLSADMDGSSSDLQSSAEGWLEDLQGLLNTEFSGRSLFAGTATDAAAVDLSGSSADPWYQGSNEALTYVGANGQTVALSVKADDPSIAELVEALQGLAEGTLGAEDALDMIKAAASGLGELQAGLSSGADRLQSIADQADKRAADLSDIVSVLKDADLAEASVLSTQYETLLETSYSTLNTLMSIKLSDYLR